MNREKSIVRSFYEHFGWSRDAAGVYKDVALFVDRRKVVEWYYVRTNRRVQRYIRRPRAASSWMPARARSRILNTSSNPRATIAASVRISRSKHSSRLARNSVTAGCTCKRISPRLPFKDGAFDAVVAAHILYHVPAPEQAKAVEELHRTTAQDGGCVILYTRKYPLLARLRGLLRAERWCATIPGFYRLHEWWKSRRPETKDTGSKPAIERPPLYAHAYPYHWFEKSFPRSWSLQVRAWRAMGTTFSRRFVPDNPLGGLLVRIIYCLEDIFPRLLLRIGRYPMIIIQK